MSGKLRVQYTSMGTPLAQSRYRQPKMSVEIRKHLNVMLGAFPKGMDTPEAQEAKKVLDGQPELAAWLRRARLLEPKGDKPTVAEVLEAGRNVLILDDNGRAVTYTEKFFNNETVRKLQEEEAKTGKPNGMLMAAHMAMFFGEGKGPGLENMETFGGLNVVDARRRGKSPVYLLNDEDAILAVLENGVSQAVDAVQAPANKLQEELDEEEEPEPPEELGEEPVVPEAPRERSFLRRFVCFFGFPHSREYRDALAQREQKQEELERYRERKPEYEREKQEYERKVRERQRKEEEIKTLREKTKKNRFVAWKDKVLENARTDAEKIIPFLEVKKTQHEAEKRMGAAKESVDRQREMEKFREDVPGMILNEGTVAALNGSALRTLQPGSLGLMLELINKKGSGVSEPRMEDDLLRSMDPEMAGRLAESSVKKAGTAGKKSASRAEEEYLSEVDTDYKAQVDTARLLFHQVFGKEPTAENVKAVAETVGLEKHIRKQMEQDGMNYEEKHRLPEITEANAGDMTLLLMTGLKSSVELNRAPKTAQAVDAVGIEMLKASRREAEQVRQAGREQRIVVYQPKQGEEPPKEQPEEPVL